MSATAGVRAERPPSGFRLWITNPWAETRFL